ncbi:MAG TPA: DUF1330 domain-containing protein [Pyrinomonadaceae bacterium]|nr:DUF1330 domain-containing protein [Pyrinomonadaceae bacterium]
MPAYLVVEVEVLDAEKFDVYRQMVPPLIAAYGGRYLVRSGALETLEGDWQPKRLVVVQFPTVEQARSWWSSSEYTDAKALRQAATNTRMVVVEGV